jgi:hypothetical protein
VSNQNVQPGQEQPGPIAQQLVRMQVNGQQVRRGPANGQYPLRGSSTARSRFSVKELREWLNVLGVLLVPMVIAAASLWFSEQQTQTSLQLAKW